jgi:hypothetical protein
VSSGFSLIEESIQDKGTLTECDSQAAEKLIGRWSTDGKKSARGTFSVWLWHRD